MRKKLLFIITKSEMGGAQRFLYEFITRLETQKYEITVAAGGNGLLFRYLEEKNIKIIKIKNFSNFFNVKNFLVFIEIFNLIWKMEPDIIYLLSSEAGFSGSIAGNLYRFLRRKNIKIIYRIGGWAFKEPRNIFIKKIYFWAEKISAPFKDIIIVNSEFDRQLAIKNKITKSEKIIKIYNGININELKFFPKDEAKKIIGLKMQDTRYNIQDTILIGTIANLYKNKGIRYLISAVEKIGNNKLHLVIIGEGPERFNLEKIIKNHGLEKNICLMGAIPEAYKYLKALDIFVFPSVKEGQPWAILEAMAAEVPIVATNIAGIPEMVENEKSGLLVEPADPDSLATAIKKILTHPSLANELTKNALSAVREKFEISEMVGKNEKLFTTLGFL